MCVSCRCTAKVAGSAQTRAVMTIREKFADQKFLMSKYKDEHMVLLLGVGVSWDKLRASDKPTSFFLQKENMYKPLPEGITVRSSSIEGLGLFATKKISASTLLGRIHIANVKEPDGYFRTPLGGFGNHSDNPNCVKILMDEETNDWWIAATVDILPGEELTWTYTLYEIK